MTAFKKVLSNHSFLSAMLFVVILFFFEEILFEIPQINFLLFVPKLFTGVEMWLLFASDIASFLLCCFFVKFALEGPRAFQVLYVFLFALSSLVQYGFWKALQRFMISADLKIATATPIDVWRDAGVLFFNWWFILPVIAFVFWLLMFGKREGLKTSSIKFGFLFFLIVALNFAYSFSRLGFNLGLSFSSFYQTLARFAIDEMWPSKRETIAWSCPWTPEKNIVLVIDESIRADHLSINGYERETTPFLDRFARTEEGVHNLGIAASSATCSYASNVLLLTGVRPGLDEAQKTGTRPTVFQYAKAMGYKTYYIDVQSNSLWNGLTDRDIPFVDSWFKAQNFGYDTNSDFRAADLIVEIVSAGSGNFIVLNKRGVHFLYEGSYPVDAAVWLPVAPVYKFDPVLTVNPYDNGIRYNVDTFFERLLVDPKILENTTILYTSDHGETLFENHVTWPHCHYTPHEAMVPLILFGRNLPAIADGYPASHSNILPTLLDLMNVPPEHRLHPYAPSLFSVMSGTKADRFYFDAQLNLYDFPDP